MAEKVVDLGTVVLGSVTGFMKDAMEKKTPAGLKMWQDLSKKITEAIEKAGLGKGELPTVKTDGSLHYKGIEYIKASLTLKQHLDKEEKMIPLRNVGSIIRFVEACGGLDSVQEFLKGTGKEG